METLKEFFKTPFGKKVEKYMWEVLSLTIALLIAYGAEANIAWVVALTPVLMQVTKWINLTYIK